MLLKGMEFDTAHFITDVSGKYPRLWALKGAHLVTVNRWYKFGALASIRTIAPKKTGQQPHSPMEVLAIYGRKEREPAVVGPPRRKERHPLTINHNSRES
ncbi:hypothetical protein ACS0TY_016842 [Phlomoides rotata]